MRPQPSRVLAGSIPGVAAVVASVLVLAAGQDERAGPLPALASGAVPATTPAAAGELRARGVLLGRSSVGRPITAVVLGAPSPRRILVVGCIHGSECAGIAITRRLEAGPALRRRQFWIVDDLNPDGFAAGTRTNGRGVDLNRNFPSEWRPIGRRWDPEYSGPQPLSEPETRIAYRLILRLRPEVTIWFHQPQALVRAWGPSIPAARRYARLAGARFRAIRWPAGTASNWQNHRFPGQSSFVVELPPGRLPAASARRYAAAVLALEP